MKYIRILLTLILGVVYWPINVLFTRTQKWYLKIKREDEVLYYAFAPFYWILYILNLIISIPYEFLVAVDLH